MESYNELYLSDNLKITKYLFHELIKSGHDFNSCVKKYMTESPIRAKMDEGNWSALNKGINQVYNSVDFSDIKESDNKYMDGIMSDFLAEIYSYTQWKYNIPSKELVKFIPPEKLEQLYYPLHETSLENASQKVYNSYLTQKEKAEKKEEKTKEKEER